MRLSLACWNSVRELKNWWNCHWSFAEQAKKKVLLFKNGRCACLRQCEGNGVHIFITHFLTHFVAVFRKSPLRVFCCNWMRIGTLIDWLRTSTWYNLFVCVVFFWLCWCWCFQTADRCSPVQWQRISVEIRESLDGIFFLYSVSVQSKNIFDILIRKWNHIFNLHHKEHKWDFLPFILTLHSLEY